MPPNRLFHYFSYGFFHNVGMLFSPGFFIGFFLVFPWTYLRFSKAFPDFPAIPLSCFVITFSGVSTIFVDFLCSRYFYMFFSTFSTIFSGTFIDFFWVSINFFRLFCGLFLVLVGFVFYFSMDTPLGWICKLFLVVYFRITHIFQRAG